jgi:hypothetical protein
MNSKISVCNHYFFKIMERDPSVFLIKKGFGETPKALFYAKTVS